MRQLTIRLLGSLQVVVDGQPSTAFESDKVRALLAYLAVESGQAHRREKLAGLLWPELPERSARNNLRVALSNLRKVIGDTPATPVLCADRQTVGWDPSGEVWIDASAFSNLLAVKGRPNKTIECLQQAIELYRGGFLQGFGLADSAEFEEWALLERERLQRQAVAALRRLAHWHKVRGEHRQALPRAQRLVALEPWQEEDQRRLMRLLALTGQRNAALAQYQSLRRSLNQELGVEPEEETTALYDCIRQGQALQDFGSSPPTSNLPVPLTPFVGRESELEDVYQCLQDPACRLLCLVGPGGSGKTRLALEVASDTVSGAILSAEDQGHFPIPDGVFFVPLAPVPEPDLVVPALAEAIGFAFQGQENPRQQILDYLEKKRLLLVLDNLEHLLPESNQFLVGILRRAPGIKVLATSRTRLNLKAEYPYALGGLALPADEPQGPDALAGYDSIELFLSGASRARPEFALTTANASDVLRICRLVEGMPLAILLAAAWVESRSPAQIADEVRRSFDFLDSGWQDAPARQRSMRAVFDHSWGLLGNRDQEIAKSLSVFRGGFTTQAAKAVTGSLSRELSALSSRSLLSQGSGGRFEIHELLRQFLVEKLTQSPTEEAAVRDRHGRFYADAVQGWGQDLKGPRQRAAISEMEADAENARAAWNWAVEQEQVAHLGRALHGLCHFYEWLGRYSEGQATCRTATEGLAPAGKGETDAATQRRLLRARLLVWQGVFEHHLGHAELARQLQRQGLVLLQDLGLEADTRSERAHALLQLAEATVNSDRHKAKEYYEQSLELFRSLEDLWGTAYALSHLGHLRRRLGFYDHQTEQLLEEALSLGEKQGDQRGMATSLHRLANLLAFRGQLETSEERYRQTIALHWENGDVRAAADAQGDMIYLLLGLGKLGEARILSKQTMAVCLDLGDRKELAYALSASSFVELHHGEYELARVHAGECLDLSRETGFAWGAGCSLWFLGCAALARGKLGEAEKSLEEGTDVLQRTAQWDEFAAARATQTMNDISLGHLQVAQQRLDAILPIPARTVGFYAPLPTLCALALLAAAQGRCQQAIELYTVVSGSPLGSNSRWFQDIAKPQIDTTAATMDPASLQAARERGKALDVYTVLTRMLEVGTERWSAE